MVRRIAVLGSTGSIGTQALEVIERSPNMTVYSILCGTSYDRIRSQVARYHPRHAAVSEGPSGLEGVMTGPDALRTCIEGSDMVLNAIVGSAGLRASLLCAELDIPLALANKESLVVGGALLREHIDRGRLIPVDSEHSTIFRCLQGESVQPRKIVLTASGGSLRDLPVEDLHSAGPDQVLSHPTWDMGARITVDSATMVNKAFEVIEARWLFGSDPDIGVVIHPQSIVHSLLQLADGSWKALLGRPDMRIPIQFALQWPNGPLDSICSEDPPHCWPPLQLSELDPRRYPAFALVADAGLRRESWPAAANAADEVAVRAFLDRRISFGDIIRIIAQVLEGHQPVSVSSFEEIMDVDARSRMAAERVVTELC